MLFHIGYAPVAQGPILTFTATRGSNGPKSF